MFKTVIQTSTLPKFIQSGLKAVGYNSKEIYLESADTYSRTGGGARAYVMEMDLNLMYRQMHTGSIGGPNPFTTCQVDKDTEGEEYDARGYVTKYLRKILQGQFVFKGSQSHNCFLGQIYVCTADYEKYKPQEMRHLISDKAWIALSCIKGYNTKGRKYEFAYKGLGDYSVKHPLVVELYEAGLLKKRGNGITVTTEGKNAKKPEPRPEAVAKAQQDSEAVLF